MTTLSHDKNTAYDFVSDTLDKATAAAVAKLYEERAKEQPDPAVIEKYDSVMKEIFDVKFTLTNHINNLTELEKIDAYWAKFVKENW